MANRSYISQLSHFFAEKKRIPALVLVKFLQSFIGQLFFTIDEFKSHRLKLSDIQRLPVDEINEVIDYFILGP